MGKRKFSTFACEFRLPKKAADDWGVIAPISFQYYRQKTRSK